MIHPSVPPPPAEETRPQEPPEAALWALTADAATVDAGARAAMERALEAGAAGAGWLVLTTCHRVEAYGWDTGEGAPPDLDGAALLTGQDAVRHLLRVAAGLESAVVGEDQILSQLRIAARSLADDPAADPGVERLAQVALEVGRRSRRAGHPRERGLADRALARLQGRTTAPLARLLVVGAGTVGRAVAFGARRRGIEVVVATRTPRRLHDGTEAVDLATAARLAPSVDAVVVALAGTWEEIAAEPDAALPPTVDLSAPPALPLAVQRRHPDLVLIDDLFDRGPGTSPGTEPEPIARIADLERSYARRAAREVARGEAAYTAWLAARPAARVAQRLVERSAAHRDERVARALRQLPELDDHGRRVVRKLAAQLIADLLHEPLSNLGHDTDGTATEAAHRLFDL